MLLSSGVVWRHRTLEDFRAECPGGDPALQAPDRRRARRRARLARVARRRAGARARRATRSPSAGATTRARSRTSLVRAAGDVRLREPFRGARRSSRPAASARGWRAERGLLLRAAPWSEGDGLAFALARGAATTAGMDEFYGRALPGRVGEGDFVRAAQLYARHALVLDDEGRDLGEPPGTRATSSSGSRPGRPGTSSTRVRCGSPCGSGRSPSWSRPRGRSGGDVRPAEELPFELPASPKLVEPPFLAVRVFAAVTHTIGGLRDRRPGARARRRRRRRCRASTPRAPTRAASSPAATAAASPPRSSTAASPPRRALALGRAACTRSGGGRRAAATGRAC